MKNYETQICGCQLTCDFEPGVIGVVGLFKSQMNISDSLPPEASKFVCNKHPRLTSAAHRLQLSPQ